MQSRVVVSGMGVITSIGDNVQTFWENCLEGRTGISLIEQEGLELLSARYGGQIKNFHMDEESESGRSSALLLSSMEEAIKSSTLDPSDIDKVYVGTTMGETAIDITVKNDFFSIENNEKLLRQNNVKNMLVDTIHRIGIEAESIIFCNACSAGNYALISAFESIKNGDAKVAVVGGVDSFSTTAYYGFSRLNAIADQQCKPFDKNRDGMIVAEGSGCLVIESLEHAQKRGAVIYAEIAGYGVSSDAFHINAPHPLGKGIFQATKNAIESARITTKEIDYISAHGTGTVANDKIESKVLSEIFNRPIPVSSIKSMLGHTMGAASAIESIVCCLVIREGKIPPTINFSESDPECNIYCVPNRAIDTKVDYAINNSYAFGGSNASIIFKKKDR